MVKRCFPLKCLLVNLCLIMFFCSRNCSSLGQSARLVSIVANRYEYSEEDTSDAPEPRLAVEEEQSAGLQFMITQRMRRVLEDDLGYLVEEVDMMEPQIAAVVIERSLARPTAGMPKSWRRVQPRKPIGEAVTSSVKKTMRTLNYRVQQVKLRIKEHFVPALKKALPVLAVFLVFRNAESLSHAASDIVQWIKERLPQRSDESFVPVPQSQKPERSSGSKRAYRQGAGKEVATRVDIRALERVARPLSWSESTSISLDALSRGVRGK